MTTMPHSPSSSSSSEAERNALLPCPFCGAPASGYAIAPHTHALRFGDFKMPDHVGSYVIEGNCSCGSGLIGATQGEVTARWNARATPPSLPIDFKQASEQGGWQPIATAPKDGLWQDGHNHYSEYVLVWYPGAFSPLRARWWYRDDKDASNFIADGGWAVFPTVWQPLPIPPSPHPEEGALLLGGDEGGKKGGAA